MSGPASLHLWRVVPLAVPVWSVLCARCDHPFLECTERFRVNANRSRHDVWLIHRCPACGARRKRRVQRRIRADRSPVPLERYRRDDPELVRQHAFTLEPGAVVPYRVDRPDLPEAGPLTARIVQPYACGVRWDRFLARELGWSRSAVVQAWRVAAIAVEPAARPNRSVRDGQLLTVVARGPALA